VALFIAGAILAFALLPTLLAIVIALPLIAGAWYFFSRPSGSSSVSAKDEPPKAKADPVATGIEALLGINLELRKASIRDELLARYEALINKIMAVLPQVHEQSPGGDLAWAINRIATEYLPNKSTRPFLALPHAERAAAEPALIEGLTGMESELDEIAELVKNRKVSDFNGKAEFLRRRFEV
jgi:hypothetical protein